MSFLPELVVHADWSLHPAKRVMMVAKWQNGRYQLQPSKQLPKLPAVIPQLQQLCQGNGCIFLGVDFPIGLPRAYAQKADITNFLEWLSRTRVQPWVQFYEVAETPEEIGLKRPFYPKRAGGTSQKQLLDRLGVESINELRRQCDLPRPGRRAAAPLFWTMGAQQVGKAAITGWRDFLLPHLDKIHIWPFSGLLSELMDNNQFVVAETYPAEIYDWLNVNFGPKQSKRNQPDRQAQAPALLQTVQVMNVHLSDEAKVELQSGFASEDAFDACVGVLGMLQVVFGKRPLFEPNTPTLKSIEGWILGQTPTH